MSNKVKVPGGAFYAGDGLTVDPITRTVSAGGGDVTTPDWNQNDATASDYIKNRPFYTGDPVENVLVEESTVSFTDTHAGFYLGQIQSTFEATVGETYKVSWDGTVYECTCAIIDGELVIGNLSIRGDGSDTGEPFLIIVFNGEGIQILAADTSASHTVSISELATEVVKIDEKYLPYDSIQEIGESAAKNILQKKPLKYFLLNSSTANSTKKFKITVDDSGNISATEVTA